MRLEEGSLGTRLAWGREPGNETRGREPGNESLEKRLGKGVYM